MCGICGDEAVVRERRSSFAQEVVGLRAWRSRACGVLLRANLPATCTRRPRAAACGRRSSAPGHRSTAPDRAMWKGSSRSLFRTLVLENSKFLLFVLTPVFTASLFWNDSVVDYIVRSRQYVTYPPEGERPKSMIRFDSVQEFKEILRKCLGARGRCTMGLVS